MQFLEQELYNLQQEIHKAEDKIIRLNAKRKAILGLIEQAESENYNGMLRRSQYNFSTKPSQKQA